MQLRPYLFSLIFLAGYYPAQAQEEKKSIEFKLGSFYNTNLNYYGRTDSLKSSGFFPLAELWFDEAFYVNAAPVFVNNAISSFEYAGTVATAGFQLKSEDSKWLGNIYAVKPFYKNSSELVQSALKAQGAFTITHLNRFLNLTAGSDVKFSDKTDFGLTGGIDHIIRKQFPDNSVLVIDPSAYVYLGTQQFSKSYLKRNDFLLFPGTEEVISEDVKKLNILSYEFSIPVIFAKGKFQALFTPAYVIPQNLVTVEGSPELSERGRKLFYATIGAKYSF